MDYTLKDQFKESLDKIGFAQVGDASYKAIIFGPNDSPAIERVISGKRDIIVQYNGPFNNINHAKSWAVMNAEDKGYFS